MNSGHNEKASGAGQGGGPHRLLVGPQPLDVDGDSATAGDQPFCVLPAHATIDDLEDAIANHLNQYPNNEPLDDDKSDSSGSISSSPPPPTLTPPGSPAILFPSPPSMPAATLAPPLSPGPSRLSPDSYSTATVGSPQAPVTPPPPSPASSPPSSPDASFSSPVPDSDDTWDLFQLSPETPQSARVLNLGADSQAGYPGYEDPNVDISHDEYGFGWISYSDSGYLYPLENPFLLPGVHGTMRRQIMEQLGADEQINEE